MKIKALLLSFFLLFQLAPSSFAIYGGESAEGSVKVLGFLSNKDTTTTICSGALISSRVAVSVAHCFLNMPDAWALVPGENATNKSKVFKVAKVIFIPGYKWSWNPEIEDLSGLKDDFVFVMFDEDVVLNYHVEIASKEDVENIKTNKSSLVLYGYGKSSYNGKTGNPKKINSLARFKTINGSEQWSSYPTEDKILSFTEDLKNAPCSGDSGGPVYSGEKIVSVMNTGNGCGLTEVGNGGMSTLIYQYMYLIPNIDKTLPTPTVKPTFVPTQEPIPVPEIASVEVLIVSVDTKIKKEISITCYKNKLTKKVTGFSPKCPKGWIKK